MLKTEPLDTARLVPANLHTDIDRMRSHALEDVRALAEKKLGSVPHIMHARTVNGVWEHQTLTLKCEEDGYWTLKIWWLGHPPNLKIICDQLHCPTSANLEIPKPQMVIYRWREIDGVVYIEPPVLQLALLP